MKKCITLLLCLILLFSSTIYARATEQFAQEMVPSESDNSVNESIADDTGKSIFIAIIIGLISAGIVLLIMRSQMNTAKAQSGAHDYLSADTYKLLQRQDVFLHSNVTRFRRVEPNNQNKHKRF